MPRKAPTAPPQPQTPAELDTAYFARLIDERMEHTREQITTLTAVIREVTQAAKDIPADDEHDPEGTTVSVERANEVALLAAAESSLIELMEARERLTTDSYGICERCGNSIPFERLEVRPSARFCVSCAAAGRRR